ncbi:transposase [Bdellovibrionota bacterium FG-2]
MPAELIYPLYRLRWQIELVFKAFKSCFRLADLPSANTHIIHVLIYAALIAAIIAYPLANILALEFKKEKRMTPSFQRSGMIIVQCATHWVDFLISRSPEAGAILIKKLKLQKNELFDPNWKRRETSLARTIRMAEAYA